MITQKKIPGCTFAERLVLEEEKVATSTFTEPIQFIITASEVLGGSNRKRDRLYINWTNITIVVLTQFRGNIQSWQLAKNSWQMARR
jgi:hypothetical protein